MTRRMAVACRLKQLPLISIRSGASSYLFLVGCSALAGKVRTQKDSCNSAELGVSGFPNCTWLSVLIFQLPDHLLARAQSLSAPYVHMSRITQMTQFFLVILGKAIYGAGETAQWVNVIVMQA